MVFQGKEVAETLELGPGPWTGKVLADVVRWQLANPDGTKQQCLDWIRAQVGEGRWSADLSLGKYHTGDGKRAKGGTSGAVVKKIRT